MIKVRCLGHIGSSVGKDEVAFEGDDLEVVEIVERLSRMVPAGDAGFNRFNTLAMVEKGEAFVPAASSKRVRDGETLVLIPFSHGG
jgi:molybdopterin converting factor small subunit